MGGSLNRKREETFSLTVGSEYLIRSVGSRDKPLETRGKYRGVGSLAQETGIVMELDESHGDDRGRLRVIPLQMILSVDVIKAEEQREEAKEKPDTVYFG